MNRRAARARHLANGTNETGPGRPGAEPRSRITALTPDSASRPSSGSSSFFPDAVLPIGGVLANRGNFTRRARRRNAASSRSPAGHAGPRVCPNACPPSRRGILRREATDLRESAGLPAYHGLDYGLDCPDLCYLPHAGKPPPFRARQGAARLPLSGCGLNDNGPCPFGTQETPGPSADDIARGLADLCSPKQGSSNCCVAKNEVRGNLEAAAFDRLHRGLPTSARLNPHEPFPALRPFRQLNVVDMHSGRCRAAVPPIPPTPIKKLAATPPCRSGASAGCSTYAYQPLPRNVPRHRGGGGPLPTTPSSSRWSRSPFDAHWVLSWFPWAKRRGEGALT